MNEQLETGKILVLPINEDAINLLKLKTDQLQSYSNLYISYENNKYDIYKDFDIDKLINKYSRLIEERLDLMEYITKISLEDIYSELNNFEYSYRFDFETNTLSVTIGNKIGVEL